MKSVGLINFHGAHNYGSALQAYALRRVVGNLGFKAETINFRSHQQKSMYKIFLKSNRLSVIPKNLIKLIFYRELKKKGKRFEQFMVEKLNIGPVEYNSTDQLKKNPPQYDYYICGSDQVWNMNCPDYEDAYFLTFVPEGKKKIAYGPSFGTTYFNQTIINKLKDFIVKIDRLSVREEQGAHFIKDLVNEKAEIVLDPTLLLSANDWSEIAIEPNIKRPYILCYFLENNMGDKRYLEYLKTKTGYDVVILNDYIRDILKGYTTRFSTGPQEFIGLFKNASLIYTNSFHGTVFANIFEKPFFVAVGNTDNKTVNNTDSRKIDFLKTIGLLSRILYDKCPKEEEILTLDFTESRKKILELRETSINYLSKSLDINSNRKRVC
ncbi:hypothetical protein F4694_000582 [Bacillus niacini]|uniref:Polysaccharide pyruvyl transferase domain-containing protein n=1 Tax=Neobacillus niacini TaxID=86668 RepID=A0A852T5H7_9BACI|nr:polysaccharide pyruvyl transferase family protein [Neobacillus niacini]NYE03863.1 hypothetical protein [Neobacillus niacini]